MPSSRSAATAWSANSPAADGDMHVAGRAPKEVGLPMVAEMMNAAGTLEKKAFDLIHANEITAIVAAVIVQNREGPVPSHA